jgi:putative transposase
MARLPRFFAPDTPLHVIQRGNNRQPIFGGTADLAFCKDCLSHAARANGVAIHAYALMSNHLHLLVTPQLPLSLPRMMQAVGRAYVRHFNDVYQRTGTLWEGRYKATIVEDERYLLTCMRYIELNPVRAGMVPRPGEYPWSSFRANAQGAHDPLVSPHALYWELGSSAETRRKAYRSLFSSPISERDLCVIRDSTQHAWALGSAAFRRKIGALGRRAGRLPAGRPPAQADAVGLLESGPTFGTDENRV